MSLTIQNHICTICSKKKDTQALTKLQLIENLVRHHANDNTYRNMHLVSSFQTHLHCPYGMYCRELKQQESKIRQLAQKIEPDIIGYISNCDKGKLHELLDLTRGYFPAATNEINRVWHHFNH